MTVKQLCADARTMAGELNFTDPNDGEMLRYSDLALQKVGKLLHGVDPRIYGQIAILNYAKTAAAGVYFSGTTWTEATKTITGTAAFTALDNAYGFVVGYIVTAADDYYSFFARCVSKTDNTLVVDRDINTEDKTIAAMYGIAFVPSVSGTSTLSISTNPVSEIVMVTSTMGDNIRSVDVDEYLSMAGNPNYDNACAYYQSGQNINVYTGSSLTGGPGVVFAFFKRSPRRVTAMTETVDLPIKYHGILRDEIAKTLMIRRGKVPPRELANPLEALEAQMAGIQKGFQLAREKREAQK